VFKSLDEVVTYLRLYFTLATLDIEDYIMASQIKVKGDAVLKSSDDKRLKHRSLSIIDSTIIAYVSRRKFPIVTGDLDLTYVAKSIGLEVIW